MAYNKVYQRISWVNKSEGTQTPLGATNLNKIDYAVNELDNRVIEQETIKADKSTVLTMVSDWSMEEETGIITVTKLNGEKILFDLNIEKIPINFVLSEDGILTMTTDDGTEYTANIGDMIPVLVFESSDEIAVSVTGEGINKTYSFSIKAGSVTEDKLQPNFLADVKTETGKAQTSAEAAAVSEQNAKNSEMAAANSEANAQYYAEQAKKVSGVPTKVSELENDSGYATDEELKKTTELAALNRQTLGYGKKNLLKNIASTQTLNGVTFAVNSDGSVTAKGINDGTFASILTVGTVKLKKGTYILNGCCENGSHNTYRIDLRYGTKFDMIYTQRYDVGNGATFTLTEEMELACCIRFEAGYTANNLTFYPMIRSADIEDGTYEPYVEDVDTRLQNIGKSTLNTLEEITANTKEEMITGALATKQIINNMGGLRFGVDKDGNYGYYKDGADTVTPFKSGGFPPITKIELASNSLLRTTAINIYFDVTDYNSLSISGEYALTSANSAVKVCNSSSGELYRASTGSFNKTIDISEYDLIYIAMPAEYLSTAIISGIEFK